MKAAVAAFRGEDHRSYWRPGIAEELASQAGLDASSTRSTHVGVRVSGRRRAGSSTCSPPAAPASVAGPEREGEMRDAIRDALAHCRQPDGSYRVANEWHVVIATS